MWRMVPCFRGATCDLVAQGMTYLLVRVTIQCLHEVPSPPTPHRFEPEKERMESYRTMQSISAKHESSCFRNWKKITAILQGCLRTWLI